MRNITLSADEELIEAARKQAINQHTTLNQLYRVWLEQYVDRKRAATEYRALMERLNYVKAGRKFTREEMNER